MKKLLMVLVLVASAVVASAQSLRPQPRRTLGSRLARSMQTGSQSADAVGTVGKLNAASVVTADGQKLGEVVRKGNGALAEVGVTLSKQERNKKLPYAQMPTEGRVADFDFEGLEPDNKAGTSASITISNMEMKNGSLVFDGKYVYHGVSRSWSDIFVPELNFDNFTIAMSFMPKAWPKRSNQFFIIGRNCGDPMAVQFRDGKIRFIFDTSRNIVAESEISLNEWNWFVCSVDAVARKVGIVVNGIHEETHSLPANFSWSISSGGNDPALRGFHFGNPGAGTRYTGMIDEFVVYDRALDEKELDRVVKRLQPMTKPTKVDRSTASVKAEKMSKSVKGSWMLEFAENRSYFWNATIEKDGVRLETHVEGIELCVQPLTRAAEHIDLTAPIVSDDGKKYEIVGIGEKKRLGGGPERRGRSKVVLRSVELPKTLKHIYTEAFRGSRLEHVILPVSVKSIGGLAFSGCRNLKSVLLPEGLELIDGWAFSGCSALASVEIPASVKSVGTMAFKDCGSLLSVTVKGSTRFPRYDDPGMAAFSGSTPVGRMFDAGKAVGPFTLEVKRDSSLAFALNGRMKEPFLDDLKFGKKVADAHGGYGGMCFKRCPEIKTETVMWHTVGTNLICGAVASWTVEEASEGTCEKSKRSLGLVFKMLSDTFPKIKLNPLKWKVANDWPSSLDELSKEYKRGEMLHKAIADNDFVRCVAESRTESDGYRIDFRVWGSKNSKIVFMSFDIVDELMQRAWGVEK